MNTQKSLFVVIQNRITILQFFALSVLILSCTNEEFMDSGIADENLQKQNAIIENPGFESGKSGWGDEDDFAISGDERSGSKAGKITSSSGKIEQTVTLSKNTNYVLTAWVDGNGKLSAGGKVEDFDVDEYTEVSLSFNSGSSSSVTIIGTRDSGDVRFDDFSLTSTGSTGSSDENLALGKVTEQYDAIHNGTSSRAVDGNTSGDWKDASITHTSRVYRPWWQVRLGNEYAIGDIIIWNRTNCCSGRLSNFDVFLYDDDGELVLKQYIEDTPSPSIKINVGGAVASRVRVKLRGTDYLSLAEVQVFGYGGSDSGDNGDDDDDDDDDDNDDDDNDDDDDDNDDGDTISPSGDAPASILSYLKNWKITFPLDSDGKDSANDSQSGNDCDDRNNDAYEIRNITGDIPYPFSEYFFVHGKEVFFKAHCAGATTSGSSYPRSELRQTPGGGDNYWSMDDYQYLDVRVRAVHLPDEKPEVSMVQIHGPDDEPLRVEYRADSQGLHVVQNEDDTVEYVLPYSLGQQLHVTVTVDNGDITCRIENEDTGDVWSDTWEAEDSKGYFKVGCYTQSTIFLEDCKSGEGFSDESLNAYGLVGVSSMVLKETY